MNSDDIIDVADLDCIYLSYDEPQKEEFWLKIKNLVPWAKRVDNVKGSDAAHKAAAEASDTERFILIDGDNMPEENFFNMQLDFTGLDPIYKKAQFRWKAINNINGLRYGNGGMSSWTKEYVMNMKTHEHSNGDDKTTVDFCLDSSDNTHMTMLTDWNPQNVQWFDNYLTMWDTVKNEDPLVLSETYGVELSNKLGLPMNSFDADQSKFFKRHYGADKYNKGPLVKEMDEVRRIQGW